MGGVRGVIIVKNNKLLILAALNNLRGSGIQLLLDLVDDR